MKNIRKWLIRIGIVLLAIVIVLAGVGTWFVRRPWPQVSGTLEVHGLLAPVEVIRDQWGVPHIYAENEHDLFFAQGYVHAQDRLWQMEINRRYISGTHSEFLGERTVDEDRFVRTIGLRRAAEQSWPELDSDSRTILESYAEGVNTYIETHRNRLALEFTILGIDPEPWTPIDSLVWGNLMAFYVGSNFHYELLRAQIAAELGEDAAQQLVPPDPYKDMPLIIPAEVGSYDWLQHIRFDGLASVDKWQGSPASVWGSNNWVIHGSRTETGMPILANDTHLFLQMSSFWYENGLHGGRFDSVGFTFPGIPLVFIGHNRRIAWGITNLDPDVEDMYIEKLDDVENPKQYEFMGEWHDIDVIQETIEVKGGELIELEILLTRHGPIVNDVFAGAGYEAMSDAEPMVLRWTVNEGSVAFRAIVLLNFAANWDEFRAALQYWDTLGQNFVYADVEGNIGYQAAGKIPIRAPEHQGLVPVPGWTGKYEWQGFIPFDELPSVLNPPAGFIATANNRVVSDDYPYVLTHDWSHAGYRARQITDLLSTGDRFTLEDMQDIQSRTYSVPAEILRPYLLAVEPENDLQAEALAHVEAWDLNYTTDSVGASIYATWYLFLIQNTVGDELGEKLMDRYRHRLDKQIVMTVELMVDADNAWFDDVNTSGVETRDDIVRRSLAEAVDWLRKQYGKDPSGWEWGRMHTLPFRHVPFGYSGAAPLERIFNGKTIPVPGGLFTVNTARYVEPYEVVFGTVQRLIVDVGDWDNSLAINSTGQSEHLFHPHREDQISMWRNVEYRPMPFSREAVEENGKDVLMLVPSSDK